MIEPRPICFTEDWADTVFGGAPLIESVVQAFVGCCQACGRPAERQREGSALLNADNFRCWAEDTALGWAGSKVNP